MAIAGTGGSSGGGGDFSAIASPYSLISSSNVTSAASVVVTGGVAPFTYQWVYLFGDTLILPVAPTSSSTPFHSVGGVPMEREVVYQCNVADSAGHVASTNTVDVSLFAGSGSS